MSFIVYCHFCSQKIECEDSDNGTFAPCPKCGKTFFIKNTATTGCEVEKKEDFFTFDCPHCSKEIKALKVDWGHIVKCPSCNKSVIAHIRKKEEVSTNGEKEYQYRQPEYKTPVLSEVFTLNFVFHIISAFVALLCIIYHFDRGNTHLAWGSVAWLIAAISAAVLCYGISEFFRFIGRISDNSDAIREFVEKTYYKK